MRSKALYLTHSPYSACLLLFALLFLLVACIPVDGGGTIQPTRPATPNAPASVPAITPLPTAGPETAGGLPSATASASSPVPTTTATSSTKEATEVPSPTATLASPPDTVPLHGDPLICRDAPQRFDLYSELGIYDIVGVQFLDDDTLLVDGWVPRQFSALSQDLNAPSLIFTQVQVDLLSSEILLNEPSVSSLSVGPCTTVECKAQSISQSPDTRWQLVTAGGNQDEIGTWLIGDDSVKRLVDFVPYSLNWTWADDSSLLWLTYSLPEFGTQALTVQLGPDVAIAEQEDVDEYAAPLNPTSHILAISPSDKKIVSTVRSEYDDLDDDDYLSFDGSAKPPQLISTEGPVMGLHTVVWDNTSERFLLIILSEDGMEIRQLDGTTLLQVPMSTFADYFPSGNQLLDDPEQLEGLVPTANYTLSPDGKTLAIAYGAADGLLVFNCVPQE